MDGFDQHCRIESDVNQDLDLRSNRARRFSRLVWVRKDRAAEPASNAILSRVAAGCSPVRLVETADSSVLFVSARGDDEILAFAPRLLESDPEHALLRAIPSGGTAPVGMRLFDGDRMLAVVKPNRFADSNGTVAVLDVSDVSSLSGRSLLKTWRHGPSTRQDKPGRSDNNKIKTSLAWREPRRRWRSCQFRTRGLALQGWASSCPHQETANLTESIGVGSVPMRRVGIFPFLMLGCK
jgi:hypothetical protein